jgi:hypothetical protein
MLYDGSPLLSVTTLLLVAWAESEAFWLCVGPGVGAVVGCGLGFVEGRAEGWSVGFFVGATVKHDDLLAAVV